MPILERDPWCEQYFTGIDCPDDVFIPTDDPDAYDLFPAHRWIYNKLLICETQGLPHGPHGVMPPAFPVFSKPIFNMKGMGIGSRIIETREAYEDSLAPGHMWMPLIQGEHMSTDVAVEDGAARWWRHTIAKPSGRGMFDYWSVLAEGRSVLETYLGDWLTRHLKGYSGMVNIETMGGLIIECHLRFANQWVDLYGGTPWVESVIRLYAGRGWNFREMARRDGYSVVLFGEHGQVYTPPDPAAIAPLRQAPGISSIQITFVADKLPEAHAMPPGGFRLAVVNCWNLDAGRATRGKLARMFCPPIAARREEEKAASRA